MLIRPAAPEDAAQIAAIWNAVIATSAATFTTDPKTEEALIADMAHRGAAFLAAVSEGAVLGFSTYWQFRGGPGYAWTVEHSIHLAPEARGQGVGRALMAALEDQARAEGMHSIIAGVSGENPEGRAFHARLGYVEQAILPEVGFKFGRWMDLVLMQKIL